ncbi:DbpA RNA binding domain-containing protein, partial [Aliarcobacter butzleri]
EIDKFEIIKEKFNNIKIENPKDIKDDISFEINSNFRTVFINGGKKQKLRKGDILGALISEAGLKSDDIGKIDVMDFCSYVAIKSDKISNIFSTSKSMRIKGKCYIIIEK